MSATVDGIKYTLSGSNATVTGTTAGAYVPATTITIPSTITVSATTYNVTAIGDAAFQNYGNITSFIIPSSIITIGVGAFSYCAKITSFTIPASVTTIDRAAFNYCPKITSFTIPASVTTIGDYAFQGCFGINSIIVDGGNTKFVSLNNVLFNNTLTRLLMYPTASTNTSYTIPSSVTVIDAGAFYSCSSLTSINVAVGNTKFVSLDNVLFNSAMTLLIQCPAGFSNITYTVPSTVTTIDSFSFQGCSAIKSITISNSVTSIGGGAFKECIGLEMITLPENPSFTAINFNTFLKCSALKSVTIPSYVKTINFFAFDTCSSLETVTISSSVETIGFNAFAGCSKITSVTFMGNIPSSIGMGNFTNTNDTAYYYPDVNNTSILPSFFKNSIQLSRKPSKPVISNVTVSNLTATIVLAATSNTIINYSYSLTIDGTTYTPFSPIQSSSPLQISGLTTGTSYTFRVKAIGTNESSDASEPYGPLLIAYVPSAPTISRITVSSGTATIAFTEGANNGSAISSYKYSKDNGANWVSVSTTSSPITVAGLNNGSTYTFVIRAVNAIGDGESSNAVEKMVNVAPGAPTINNVTFSSGITIITFTEGANNGSPVTSYKYSKDNGANWVSVSTTSSPIEISGLKPGISHQIILKASNGLDSDPSNTHTFTYYIKTCKTL
jgi:hypothetical protein